MQTNTRILISLLQLFMLALIATLFIACTKKDSDRYSGPPTKIVIGVYKGELSSIVYMADHLGYFKQLGLDVELRDYESGAAAVKALNEEKVDLATAADFVFASNIAKYPDLRTVAAINRADNIYIVARQDRGIKSVADLKGKRIAVTFTTPSEYFIGKQLNRSRLTFKDVNIVNVAPSDMEREMQNGSFDAAVVWNPVAQRIKDSLGANAISFNAQNESFFDFLLVARESFIKKESPALVRLMKALILAEQSIAGDPVKSGQFIAQRIGMPDKYVATVWKDYQFVVYLDRTLLLVLEEESRWIAEKKGTAENSQPNYLNYLYLDALKSVRPDSVTITK